MKTKQIIQSISESSLFRSLRKGIVIGIGFVIGTFSTTIIAVAVTGTSGSI